MSTGSERNARWQARAQRVEDSFGLVLALILVTYVLVSVVEDAGWGAVLITVSTTITAVVALASAQVPSRLVRVAAAIAVIAVLASIDSAGIGGKAGLNAASFLVIGLLAVAMGAVLQRVLVSGKVSSQTILGAISVYTSLGLLFTWVYALIDRLEGGGFFGEGVKTQAGDFLFFSYTTLTTTGYGDLVPVGHAGRMVSGIEMMLGQIFLVTLVAGLVSLWRPGEALLRRRERRSERDAPRPSDAG